MRIFLKVNHEFYPKTVKEINQANITLLTYKFTY